MRERERDGNKSINSLGTVICLRFFTESGGAVDKMSCHAQKAQLDMAQDSGFKFRS